MIIKLDLYQKIIDVCFIKYRTWKADIAKIIIHVSKNNN